MRTRKLTEAEAVPAEAVNTAKAAAARRWRFIFMFEFMFVFFPVVQIEIYDSKNWRTEPATV